MNLRVNFDKNKKASRIKALREFSMKRLTDFFGEKDWKTVEIRYNENMKRSKHCCWNVPMSDWNAIAAQNDAIKISIMLNRTYEWLKLFTLYRLIASWYSWTVPMSDWNCLDLTKTKSLKQWELHRIYERLILHQMPFVLR